MLFPLYQVPSREWIWDLSAEVRTQTVVESGSLLCLRTKPFFLRREEHPSPPAPAGVANFLKNAHTTVGAVQRHFPFKSTLFWSLSNHKKTSVKPQNF